MSEKNPLEALFKSNLTKAQFVEKYRELKESHSSDEEEFSIFSEDLELSASELFDTLNTTPDDVLDDNEIAALRGLYDDGDNNETITASDLDKLYTNTIKRMEERIKGKTAEQIYNEAKGGITQNGIDYGRGNPQQIISEQIDSLNGLMSAKERSCESKIKRYENLLDNLIITQSDLSEKDKREYSKNRAEINNKKTEIQNKERLLQSKQQEMELASAEIDYNKKHKDINKPEVVQHINEFSTIYNNLLSEVKGLTSEINTLSKQIQTLVQKQNALCEKAKSNNADFQSKKKELMQSIENERNELKSERESYTTQISMLESAQNYAVAQDSVEYPSEYYDEDTSNFSYDSQELESKWKKKWTKTFGSESKVQAKIDSLGGSAFFNKVCAIAQRLNCDSNALMGVMNSESGVSPSVQNQAGGSAVGLIQFMPSTAKGLGTTSDALRSMSAIEQLNYVEKYLQNTKKSAGFSSDAKIDSGTLYTLVFLPGYANRDVLTVKGHKFYDANSGLDRDGDERITKADMARRVHEKMA